MREPIEIKIISMGSLWRRRRDSNPRTAYDRYTISNRARSTGLRDFSRSRIISIFDYSLFAAKHQNNVIIQKGLIKVKR